MSDLNLDEIPIIDSKDKNFNQKLKFEIWSTQSSTDYENDRNRPYNGQSWTLNGERGKTEVKNLTMRDISDCLIKAMLISSPNEEYFKNETYLKCWNFDECKNDSDKPKPTQFLLDNQDKFLSTKVELNTWRTRDIYKINWNDIDPMAIIQNLGCEIEKMMNIYPNIK